MPLASLAPHPEVAEACAPLFDMFDRVARASVACSPLTAERVDDFTTFVTWIPRAVHLYVAPLVQRGDLASAARHVTNAMRVADDLGRDGSLVGVMLGVGFNAKLGETLNEILLDPRLTAVEARAIGADLDLLRATAPAFISIMRQENAWLAIQLERADDPREMALAIFEREQLMRVIEASCQGTTDACAAALKRASGGALWLYYVERLGYRDIALRNLRTLAEQRTRD